MNRIEKLKEIRDNFLKKTYVKNMFGDYDLEKLMDLIIKLTKDLNHSKNSEEFHNVLFRISSRILNMYGYNHYVPKNVTKFNTLFRELCKIKDSYWKAYLRKEENNHGN
jgi:hypothetical protein